MTEFSDILKKLERFYWSEHHPSQYVIRTHAGNAGIGLIAHRNYAAFNLTWLSMPLVTMQDMHAACAAFTLFNFATEVEVRDGTVGDHILTKTPAEFKRWFEANKSALPGPVVFTLRRVFENAVKPVT